MKHREVPMAGGFVALVDEADYDAIMAAGSWTARPHGRTTYAQRCFYRDGHRTTQQMHVFLLGVAGIDHVNGNGLDNRRRNLRAATRSQNMANQRLRLDSTSGFKGVTRTSSGRWMARAVIGDRRHSLGTFDTPIEAALAYDAAAREHFGEFARLNFPAEKAS